MNTYLYANGNPLVFIDPLGLNAAVVGGAGRIGSGFGSLGGFGNHTYQEANGGYATYPSESSVWDDLNDDIPDDALDDIPDVDEPEQCSSDDEDDGDRCYQNYLNDVSTCRAISRFRGYERGAACYSSASERLAACNENRPLPPLNTWNN